MTVPPLGYLDVRLDRCAETNKLRTQLVRAAPESRKLEPPGIISMDSPPNPLAPGSYLHATLRIAAANNGNPSTNSAALRAHGNERQNSHESHQARMNVRRPRHALLVLEWKPLPHVLRDNVLGIVKDLLR